MATLTYLLLHAPQSPGHLIWNMLLLYMFQHLGSMRPKRFLKAYLIFGLSGAGLIMIKRHRPGRNTLRFSKPLYETPTLGASAAVMGMMTAWGIVHANQSMNFFLIGQMKMTFVFIIIGIELLRALSFDNVSSTAHFGGIIGIRIMQSVASGKLNSFVKRSQLKMKKKRIEHQLKVIKGGKNDDDKMKWN